MKPLSIRYTKLARLDSESALIKKMKAKIKKEPALIKKYKEYGVSPEIIDRVPVEFVDLEVSAKTKGGKIYINRKFVDDFDKASSYLLHEAIHIGQRISGNMDGAKKKEYLDKDTEIDAFQAQISYKKKQDGKEDAEEYTDHLLDHHDLHGKKRKEKKKELLEGK